jgi:hypothetical protein
MYLDVFLDQLRHKRASPISADPNPNAPSTGDGRKIEITQIGLIHSIDYDVVFSG